MDGATIGALIGVAFGCIWGLGGASSLPRPWREWAMGISLGISLALVIALVMPHAPRQSAAFRGRIYGIAVAFEVIAIFTTAWVLKSFCLPQFLLPALGFIVGLHFIGLWRATGLVLFLWTAIAMCAVCVFAAFLPTATRWGISPKAAVSGLGCAIVLWVSSGTTLLRHPG